MTEEFVHRMGVNASMPGDSGNNSANISLTETSMPTYRDTMGVIVRLVKNTKNWKFASLFLY